MNIVIIKFDKPTHWQNGSAWVNLRENIVEKHAKNNDLIVLKLPEGFTQPIPAKEILKKGKKTQAVFNYPNNPMKLVGYYFPLLPENKQKEAVENPFFWEINYMGYQV